ncbi:MAG: NAD(P)-dependent oxidoreductase [Candidatus Omnitrophica bacterium]|nr:NAD(P)-dependent oxidoreductase [Candidatus Omnitrophota bacterium]
MGQSKETVQPKQKRTKNFNEVSLGYSKKVAVEESRRCPQCADPVCVNACPIGINIPGFIRRLREGNVGGAYELIREQNPLPSICGRICLAPCELACILNEEKNPIGIRALERYAADNRSRSGRKEAANRGMKIAIVGSGPAGLSAAAVLAQKGYQVRIFESMDQPGGVLRYGIPEFRIPNKILEAEINEIKALGVEIETNCMIGNTKTMDDLKTEGYVSILLAMGAGIPKFMEVPGSHLGGVYYGEEFLMRINQKRSTQFPLGNKIVVIGSGNTALDCARVAVRLQKQVTLIFRRTIDELYMRDEEKTLGMEEGIHFEPLVKPMEILPTQDNFVSGIKCVRMDYADEDSNGTWSLAAVPDSEFTIEADSVIIAVGHLPNSNIIKKYKNIKLNDDSSVKINESTHMTNTKSIFAAGNVVTNAGPVVEAIASGKAAAEQIHKHLVG